MSIDLSNKTDDFVGRHVGPNQHEIQQMLRDIGESSLDSFIDKVVPPAIRTHRPLQIGTGKTESKLLTELRAIAAKNKVRRSLIGMGYNETITPSVILRNILENPGWYTQYTPYQSEISQGRLEALLNFQTMIIDLTGLEIANASLLDEATAAAEAMNMIYAIKGASKQGVFFVSQECHPQTLGRANLYRPQFTWLRGRLEFLRRHRTKNLDYPAKHPVSPLRYRRG